MSESKREGSTDDVDVIELRLPPKHEYQTILRATAGAIAGTMSFNYDEIMQLRVAISEAFDLAIKHGRRAGGASELKELDIWFSVEADKLEFAITDPKDYTDHEEREEEKESQVLIRSLMDEVEYGAKVAGKTVIRATKYISSDGIRR